MSRKGFIIVAAIFVAAFLLLALATRGYRKLEEMRRSAEPIGHGANACEKDRMGAQGLRPVRPSDQDAVAQFLFSRPSAPK